MVSAPEVTIRAATDSAGTLDRRLITVTGLTLRGSAGPDLGRVVIVCCAADARLARIHLGGSAAAAASYPRGHVALSRRAAATWKLNACKLFRADIRNRERDEGRPARERLCLLKPSQRISKDREIMDLAPLADRPFTYTDIGATSGRLPHGYHHVNESARIGTGRARFEEAAERVMRWGMLRGAGARVTASADVAQVGSVVVVGLGPVRAPCRVVYVVHDENRRGFAYGTLPGHPESGEELFAVRYDPADDAVYAEVVAFSRHATWWSKAAGPLTSVLQRMMTKRYLSAV